MVGALIMETIAESWDAWVAHCTKTHGPPPPDALPLLKQTYYTGVLNALSLLADGVKFHTVAEECYLTAHLEGRDPKGMHQA